MPSDSTIADRLLQGDRRAAAKLATRPLKPRKDNLVERPWGGVHGYAPEDQTMAGIFLAAGPQIASAGRIDAFENVHIYSLLTALLGLAPNLDIDGDSAVLALILQAAPGE